MLRNVKLKLTMKNSFTIIQPTSITTIHPPGPPPLSSFFVLSLDLHLTSRDPRIQNLNFFSLMTAETSLFPFPLPFPSTSMPPPPLPPYSVALSVLILLTLYSAATAAHSCFPKPSSFSKFSCPPFTSPPPFPFSSSPGCGHPSFQIKCSAPHSTISINNLSFSLISYDPIASSLLLSPHTTNSTVTNCSSSNYPSIPSRSINISATPFRISDASCSRLSVLKPCFSPNLPNCSHCPWDCKLIKHPLKLLNDCGSPHRPVTQQGCHDDVLSFLDDFLKIGIELEWDEAQDSYFSSCRACKSNNGFCGFNSSDPIKQFLCFYDETHLTPPWISKDNPNRITILSSVFTLACFLLVVSVVIAVFRSKRLSSAATEEDPTALFLHRHRSANLLPPVFTYEELESSTNQFDPKRKIGDGGFGSVYLGQLYDGRVVAVKHLHKPLRGAAASGKAFSNKCFCNEILILSSIDHPNLVKLHGYCSDPRGLLLVYDYVPNGTLADHLHGPKSLYRKGSMTWQVRVDIALQTAMVMEYLHFSVVPPVVHRDITSSNIFVEKDMRIKVGDFGLSRLLVFPERTSSSSGYVWTGPQGTPGYLDPDYHRSFRLTDKSDVYSFGVVLLELISGLKAVDQRRDKRELALADLVVQKIQTGLLHQVVDPVLVVDGDVSDGVYAAAELAFRCVAADKDDRPDAKEVVEELKRIRSRTRGVSRASSPNVMGEDVAKG
ncbi:LEAF RUST 10 DISEASE-RESISTANCE LOCUS RECEPTOR-LIKE PROTEIN KINASE-like 1.5 [Malus sylvestris]|uniref:LEAF RUST 10 DISEASE-RESISTANCE LOCUS RECEPTOR-LIKE PROTEIN KINASE-like 1.5 n=1 Tax=Malus sylvestris TaxID=3752 RepID=UPI0021ACCDC6|nr:LEAF RUST 10 DISEASE-RESISTANCE LOCUS RECEPTOR-LIKE PROTEIN KINASE-like 1.5 [Malus sylvestris]